MKGLILSCLFCVFTNYFFAQNYCYSFEGDLPIEKQELLVQKIYALPLISTCKIRYKGESKKGEFFIYVVEKEGRSESDEEFSPVQLKNLLIEQGLVPIDFRLIK